MIKRLFTALGMLISSVGFSQKASDPLEQDPSEEIIARTCGSLGLGTLAYDRCVEKVSMDFTIIPHNKTVHGGCPGLSSNCQDNHD